MRHPDDLVRFRLTHAEAMIIGLDDSALRRSSYPSLMIEESSSAFLYFVANRADAHLLMDDFDERSESGEGGFEHTATERRRAANAASKISEALGV